MLHGLRSRRGWLRSGWLAVCAAALLLRIIVPTGWMPVFDASGTHLVICDGVGPMPGMSAGMSGHHMPKHTPADPGQSHPCAFAALGLAFAIAAPITPSVLFHANYLPPRLSRTASAVGRGLAAPPPPATGPPAFA